MVARGYGGGGALGIALETDRPPAVLPQLPTIRVDIKTRFGYGWMGGWMGGFPINLDYSD